MPTLLACKSCGKKLQLRDGVTATKVRCPGCGEIISLAKTAITAKRPATQPKEDEEPRPKPDSKAIREDPPPFVKPPPRPDSKGSSEEEPDDDEPRPRKKKRKRRSKPKKDAPEVPLWVWGAVAGTFLLLAGIISAAVIHAGHGALLLVFAIGMAIILPVSVVILVISMFIASALLGGIDFGQAHVAIPKAGTALLFVVNLLSMIPIVGAFLALPVWFLGLMGLFGLDFAEARILVAVNWCLNSVFKYFVLAAILSGILHSGSSDGPRPIKVPSGEAAAVKKIEALGGHCDSDDDEDDGGHITEVTLENTPFDDASLSLLRSFPKLRALHLANTRVTDQGLRDVANLASLEHLDLSGDAGVTDAGLNHLAGLSKLQVISLAGTRVTEGGIQKLRAARPGLQVVR